MYKLSYRDTDVMLSRRVTLRYNRAGVQPDISKRLENTLTQTKAKKFACISCKLRFCLISTKESVISSVNRFT